MIGQGVAQGVLAPDDAQLIVKSDLHFAILHRFRGAGITVPFPQREVRLRDHEPRSMAARPTAGSQSV